MRVFANCLRAVVVSASWIAFGARLRYPDVRVHQYDAAPLALRFDESAD